MAQMPKFWPIWSHWFLFYQVVPSVAYDHYSRQWLTLQFEASLMIVIDGKAKAMIHLYSTGFTYDRR
jgi:hypothetical protein